MKKGENRRVEGWNRSWPAPPQKESCINKINTKLSTWSLLVVADLRNLRLQFFVCKQLHSLLRVALLVLLGPSNNFARHLLGGQSLSEYSMKGISKLGSGAS